MKLIDACALTRTMYLKSFETDDGRQRWDSGLWIRYKIFEEARDEQLIVDAVPVIRCKDCLWHHGTICRRNNTMFWDAYDFCSQAERKES